MDMVVRLLGQNGGYDSAMATSRTGTWRLNQSLDNLTQSMARQLEMEKVSTRQAEILALADKGASAAKVEYALSLSAQLDQQQALRAAEQQDIALKEENEAWTRKVIATEHERNRLLGVSTAYLKMKELAERGATQAEIQEYYAAYQVNQALNQQTMALQRKTVALRMATSAQMTHSGASTRGMFAIQALAFGLQDAAQVYGTMGLAGALSASANNLVFMTSLMKPQLAIYTALAVAAAQFAAVLVPLAMGWRDTSKDGERLNETLQKQLDLTLELSKANRDFNQKLAEVSDRSSGSSLQRETRSKGVDIRGDIADQEAALNDLLRRREKLSEMASWGELTTKARDSGQAEIDKEIAKTQDKLRALDQKKSANDRDQVKADQAAAYGEQQTRIADSHEANRRYQEENRKRDADLVDAKIKAERAAWDEFYQTRKKQDADWVKEKAQLEKSLGMETAQKITDYRAAKQAQIDRDLKSELGQAQTQRNSAELDRRMSFDSADPAVRAAHLKNAERGTAEAASREAAAMRKAAYRTSQLDEEVGGLGADAADAAARKEAADKSAMASYEEDLKGRRKNYNALTDDARGKSRSAVDARSADGFAKLFDAMGGSNNPQRDVAKNTRDIFRAIQQQLKFEEAQLEAMKNLKPVKSKKG